MLLVVVGWRWENREESWVKYGFGNIIFLKEKITYVHVGINTYSKKLTTKKKIKYDSEEGLLP